MRNSRTKRGIFFGLLCAAMLFAPLAAFAAAGQTITIDTTISDNVYGNGDSTNGTIQNGNTSLLKNLNENTVKIQNGGVVDSSVYGSYFADQPNSTIASGNSVTIDGGKVNGEAFGGSVLFSPGFSSGATDASTKSNDVTLNSGSVGNAIYGGSSVHLDERQAHAVGNTVTITGGTAGGGISGGESSSYGGSADSLNNSVTVTGGTITGGFIYGGYADSDGSGKSGVANGNSVVLSGGDIITGFGHLVFGGYSRVDGNGETGAATGNSVTVSDDLTLSGSGALSVYGGFVGSYSGIPKPGTDAFTGNTFNKNSKVLVTAAGNFENVSFGYTGDANITRLDTTPGGSAKKTVNIDTKSNNVNFNGVITGSGNINKKGSGELTLTDITGLTGTITLSEGTIKNNTNGPIDVIVDGTSRQFAPDKSTNTNSGGGGCDAGTGAGTLALLVAAALWKRRGAK